MDNGFSFTEELDSYSEQQGLAFDEEEPPAEDVLDTIGMEQSQTDDAISEVDRRLELVHFYRRLLNHDFFDERTTGAVEVQDRIRKFIRSEVEELIGLRAKPAPAPVKFELPFTVEETAALKGLALTVLKRKPELAQAHQQPQKVELEPQVPVRRVAQTPPAAPPKPRPAVRRVATQPAAQPPRQQPRPLQPPTTPRPPAQRPQAPQRRRPQPKVADLGDGRVKVGNRVLGEEKTSVGPNGEVLTYRPDFTQQRRSRDVQPIPQPGEMQAMTLAANEAEQNLKGVEGKLVGKAVGLSLS